MRALPSQAFDPLETAILGVLCARHHPLTVREIHAALHDRALAYTTIMTTMARMTEKAMLSRAPTAARYAAAYRYTAPIGRLNSAAPWPLDGAG
jgi:predicted transcriptional regulator